MQILENALKIFANTGADIDLETAMSRLSNLTRDYYKEKKYPGRSEIRILAKTFAIDLKIGRWPNVLQGEFNDNFRCKTKAFLEKIHGDAHKAAEAMLKQCKETVDKNVCK